MSAIKILHILNYYFPHLGGIEDVCKSIVDGTTGYERKVLCYNDTNITVYDQVDGIEVIRVGMWKEVARQQISFYINKILKETLIRYQPDIIHMHVPNPLTSALVLAHLPKKTKLIVHWHSDITVQPLIHLLYYPIEMKMLKRADCIIATSPNYIVGSPYISKFHKKCLVIPNVISLSKMNLTPTSGLTVNDIQREYGHNIVLFLGRHVPYKGIEYLIKAVPHIKNECKILICGKGPKTEELRKMAAGIPNIIFKGRIEDDELNIYLRASRVFAFPSITKNEAFGIALAEAMYCGAVPVTFTIEGSGVNWVNLNGITGIEVPNKDVRGLAQAIDTLLADNDLHSKYATESTERVKSNFLLEHIHDKLTMLYNGLMK